MAGEAKAPDNRLFQLVMVIITSIVAPLTVYFVTNSSKNTAPEPPAIQATAVLPAAASAEPTVQVVVVTATPEPTATFTATATVAPGEPTFTAAPPTPTEAGVRDARGDVPAGTTILADAFALVLDSDAIQPEDDYLRLTIRVHNIGAQAAELRYTLKAITVKDDTGRTYAPFIGEKGRDCKKQEIDERRSLNLEPGETFTLQSPERENANWFCSGDHPGTLPLYIGPIHKDAKQIFVQIKDFGPFTGFAVQIER